MIDRYGLYEELRDRGLELRMHGHFEAGDALLELARLVLQSKEKEAAEALRRLPGKG